jgi:hypothetical protein
MGGIYFGLVMLAKAAQAARIPPVPSGAGLAPIAPLPRLDAMLGRLDALQYPDGALNNWG